MLPGAVVIADDGPHALHYAVGGQIQEGLQLIVHTQYQHVYLRVSRQNDIEGRDQQRGQCQVEGSGHSHRIQTPQKALVGTQCLSRDADIQRADQVKYQVQHQTDDLTDTGRPGSALNAHAGNRAQAKNHDGVQDDVGHTAAEHADHGQHHLPRCLVDLFKRHGQSNDHRKAEGDAGIPHPQVDDQGIGGEEGQKGGHTGNADGGKHQSVQGIAGHTLGGGPVGLIGFPCAQIVGNDGVDADGKADGHRVDEVLHREYQRKGGHGLFTDASHKVAVHDVVQR